MNAFFPKIVKFCVNAWNYFHAWYVKNISFLREFVRNLNFTCLISRNEICTILCDKPYLSQCVNAWTRKNLYDCVIRYPYWEFTHLKIPVCVYLRVYLIIQASSYPLPLCVSGQTSTDPFIRLISKVQVAFNIFGSVDENWSEIFQMRKRG